MENTGICFKWVGLSHLDNAKKPLTRWLDNEKIESTRGLMKTIIIAGVPRSGKSTLSKQLSKDGNYSYIPFDAIVSTSQNLYPDLGISHFEDSKEVSKKTAPFIAEFLKHLVFESISAVIDVYQLYPIDIVDQPALQNVDILFLGYPDIYPQEKMEKILKHARKGDWTEGVQRKELLSYIQKYIDESKIIKEQCQEYGFQFIDTGSDYEEVIKQVILGFKMSNKRS